MKTVQGLNSTSCRSACLFSEQREILMKACDSLESRNEISSIFIRLLEKFTVSDLKVKRGRDFQVLQAVHCHCRIARSYALEQNLVHRAIFP